jgi:hypothetical protein
VETRLALGMANFKIAAIARGSDPVKLEGVVPIQLEKRDQGYAVATNGPLSATLSFPAVFLAKLPSYLSRGIFTRGILSGNVTIADSVQQPLITGGINLVDGKFLRGPTVSADVAFKGRKATIDFVHLREPRVVVADELVPLLDVSARGEIEFVNLDDIQLKIFAATTILASSPALAAGDCVSSVTFFPASVSSSLPSRQIQEIGFGGSMFARSFTISLPSPNPVDPPEVFPFCRDSTSRGQTLTIEIAPALVP